MASRTASCACGRLTIRCHGEPTKVSVCHCHACQRRTGSAFGIAAFFDRALTGIAGESHVFERVADSGFMVTHHFCPHCGSTVFWYPARKPEAVAVALGAFADPGFPAPSQAVHGEQAHGWVRLAL